jgi:TonB family protein
LEAEMIYDNNNIVEATTYYRTGNKHIFLTKSNNVLNGSYKIWFENGKLNLEGNYENNEKDGHFQLFDEFGTLVREGNYERGKLVSGEAVVADLLYENPNTKASFSSGPEAFSDVLKKRSAELEEVKKLDATYSKYLNLKLKIGKKGIVSNVDFISNASDNDIQIIKKVFYGLTDFIPGKEEGVSVNSILYIEVQLSNGGLNLVYDENDTIDNSEYFIVEEMPEYPGGETALRQFIATKIKYPVLAQENGIQGKVYVSFVIDKDGLPGSFTILQSVHPLLDEEAINVLKSMPRWKPGFQKGKPVRVLYTVPVGFVLQ